MEERVEGRREEKRLRDILANRAALLASMLALCTLLAVWGSLLLGTGIAYTHLFYIPICIGAIWFGWRALPVALYLFGVHFAAEYLRTGMIDVVVIARGGSFVLLIFVVGWVSAGARRGDRTLIAYLQSLYHRTSPAGRGIRARFDGIRAIAGRSEPVRRMARIRDVHGLAAALGDRNPEIRYQAADALAKLRDPRSIQALAGALRDTDMGVRWKSLEALVQIGSPALQALGEASRDPDAEVRWRAVVALSLTGTVDAIDPLAGRLGDPDPYVRGRAAIGLGSLGKPALGKCMAALSDPDGKVRTGAALALGLCGDPEAVGVLLAALVSGDPMLAEAAEKGLMEARAQADAVVPGLLPLLQHPAPEIRRRVARLLGELGDERAIQHLGPLAVSGEPEERAVAAAAIRAISRRRRHPA